jgi:superfamily II DNA or RNA helicase
LGVTATPDRGDKKSLAKVFQNIAYEYSLRTAIEEKNLCNITAKLLPTKIDLSDIRTVAGDYNAQDLEDKISPLLVDVSRQIAQNIGNRKTLIFLPLIKTSQTMTELMNLQGIASIHVDGTSKDRKEILADYESGKYQVLCNSSLLLEGYDCPEISCVVSLRPTKIRSLYCQMIGRGTRIHPNKEDLLILDFLWQSTKHDLCVPASLFAKTKEESEALSGKLSLDKETDLLEAERDVIREREESLLKQLKEKSYKQGKTINPLMFALSIHADDLSDYDPTSTWEIAPATDKQIQFLTKSGFDPDTITCKGHASKIIDRLMKRREIGLATPKQVMLLSRYKIDASNMSFETAGQVIDKISQGWKKKT